LPEIKDNLDMPTSFKIQVWLGENPSMG